MPTSILDDREYSSFSEATPEDQERELAYFKEKYPDAEIALSTDGQPAEEPAKVIEPKPEDKVAEPVAPPVDGTLPAEPVAPATPPAEVELDAESQADWQSAKSDGEKQGKYARRTKALRELEGKTTKLETEIEVLRRQLAEREKAPVTPAPPSPLVAPAVVADPPKKVSEPEPIKAKEFEKPKPARPKLENYQGEDDPIAAHTEAIADFAEKLSDWKDEKRDFDSTQKELVATEQREREQKKAATTQREEVIKTRFEDARKAHPDFEQTTSGMECSPVLRYLLVEELPDGLNLGYQLARPENAETLKAINEATKSAKTDAEVQKALYETVGKLAVFREKLNAPPPKVETPVPVAAAAPPVPAKVETPVLAQTPSPAQPRKEDPSPEPNRGRGGATERIEDIADGDYDARLEYRKRHKLP